MTREKSRSATALRETAGSHMVKNFPRTTADTLVNTVIRSFLGVSSLLIYFVPVGALVV